MAWQKVRIDLPENLNTDQRQEAAQSFVDRMIQNATNGVGVDAEGQARRKFPKYTKDYEKIKGQSEVDLTLSGEMLSALKVISTSKRSVLIGFDNGSQANAKAEGNILGSYGRNPDPKKARNFLGLIPKEIRQIINEINNG